MEYTKINNPMNDTEDNVIVNEKIKALSELFPEIVKDGEIDFKALKEELGKFEEIGSEKFELTWAGKQNAKKKYLENVSNRTLKLLEEESKNPNETENLYIEGDNLEVLKLLRKNYYNSIKMIYIDPPYNTDKDFIYNDSFKMTQEEHNKAEGYVGLDNERLEKVSKTGNRYHANWLNMMYPRLKTARDLLTDDGVIFIHIDEHEVYNLQQLCNEIFGEDNEVGTIIWDKRNPKGDSTKVAYQHESILIFAKNKIIFNENEFVKNKENAEEMINVVAKLIKKYGEVNDEVRKEYNDWIKENSNILSGGEKAYKYIDENGEIYQPVSMAWPNNKKAPDDYFIPLIHPITKKECPLPSKGWRNPSRTMKELLENNKILFGIDETTQPRRKYLLKDNMTEAVSSLLYYGGSDSVMEGMFNNPKPVNVVKKLLSTICKNREEIILDFFSGSASTAHAVMQLNAEDGGSRKFIMVQVDELTYTGKKEKYKDENGEQKERYIIDKETGFPVVDKDSDARKNSYYTIPQIGRARIDKAGEKIKKEIEDNNNNLKLGEEPKKVPDIGFKTLKTGDTNIKWNRLTDILNGNLTFAENNDPDSMDFELSTKDIDVVYELMLLQRDLPLSEQAITLDEIGLRTYLYANSYLVCLETQITDEIIEKIANLNPVPIKFFFRDSAFGNDIALKDNIFNKFERIIEKNSITKKKTYTVEFI